MSYIIIGLKEDGNMSLYQRDTPLPDEKELLRICSVYHYTQVMVAENVFGGTLKLYKLDNEPMLRKIPC